METSFNKQIVEESLAQAFPAEEEIVTEEHVARLASLVANRFVRALSNGADPLLTLRRSKHVSTWGIRVTALLAFEAHFA